MTIYDVDIDALAGGPAGSDRYRGPIAPVVNVACRGMTTPDGPPIAVTEKLLPR